MQNCTTIWKCNHPCRTLCRKIALPFENVCNIHRMIGGGRAGSFEVLCIWCTESPNKITYSRNLVQMEIQHLNLFFALAEFIRYLTQCSSGCTITTLNVKSIFWKKKKSLSASIQKLEATFPMNSFSKWWYV